MSPKIPLQDSNCDKWDDEEILKAYKKAAESDEFMFGDYNFYDDWIGTNTNDVA